MGNHQIVLIAANEWSMAGHVLAIGVLGGMAFQAGITAVKAVGLVVTAAWRVTFGRSVSRTGEKP